MTANIDGNLSSCKCQSSSVIQETSKRIKGRRGETSKGRREVKEWEVEKILNKRKVREVVKYLV